MLIHIKNFTRLLLAVVFLAMPLVGCSSSEIAKHPLEIELPELSYNPRAPQRFTMGNGMVVFSAEDMELPLVSGSLIIPIGSLRMGEFPTGLGVALGSQLREGGTKKLSPDKLDAKLDSLAASIEASMGDEFLTIGFSCLAEDFEEVFAIFSDVVRRPRFDAKRFDLWKKLSLDGIRRRKDDPGTMASMAFERLLFGSDSIYARSLTSMSVRELSVAKLTLFHKNYVGPEGARLVVSGALKQAKLKAEIEKHFVDWPGALKKLPRYPAIKHKIKPGVYVLERDFKQASVLIGHRGPRRITKDMYARQVFNKLFGYSGFDSRLFKEIRSKRGLAYSVYGALFPDVIEGTFQIGMGTRVDAVEEAVKAAEEEIAKAIEEPFNSDDLENAKTGIRRSFVFKFSTPSKLAERAAYLELMGFPKSYDIKYLENIEVVDVSAVHEVAKRNLHPERLVTVIVGDVSAKDLADKFGSSKDVYQLSFDEVPEVVKRLSR